MYARPGPRYHRVELDKVKQEWKALTTKEQKMRYIEDRKTFVAQSHEVRCFRGLDT